MKFPNHIILDVASPTIRKSSQYWMTKFMNDRKTRTELNCKRNNYKRKFKPKTSFKLRTITTHRSFLLEPENIFFKRFINQKKFTIRYNLSNPALFVSAKVRTYVFIFDKDKEIIKERIKKRIERKIKSLSEFSNEPKTIKFIKILNKLQKKPNYYFNSFLNNVASYIKDKKKKRKISNSKIRLVREPFLKIVKKVKKKIYKSLKKSTNKKLISKKFFISKISKNYELNKRTFLFLQNEFWKTNLLIRIFDINFLRKEKIYSKLKYSRVPQYDIVSGGAAALLSGFLGFLICEKFGFELLDSGDFYVLFMYLVFISFFLRPLLKITEENKLKWSILSYKWFFFFYQNLILMFFFKIKKLFNF